MNSKFQKSLSSTITRSKYITNFNLHGQAGGTLPQKNGCDRNLFRSIRATLDRLIWHFLIFNYTIHVKYGIKLYRVSI